MTTTQTENPAAKSYVGERRRDGAHVFVREGARERPLEHHVRHSPGGMEWGYAGSGPAELARCILIDYFGPEAVCAECEGGWIESAEGRERCWHCAGEVFSLPVSYQEFKFEFIASLAQGSDWEISAGEIEQWVREKSEAATAHAAEASS